MSGTLQKLEQLLSRVQERRSAPRVSTLAVAEARTTQVPDLPFSTPPPSTGRISKAPVPTPLEESMEALVPVQRAPEPVKPFQPAPVAAPDSDELVLDDFEPPPTIAPPAAARAPAPAPAAAPAAAPMAPAAVVAPAPSPKAAPAPMSAPAAVSPFEPAPVASAPITAATARISPAAPTTSASPVAAVSKARSIEPKSFGELLDLSLALRPAK